LGYCYLKATRVFCPDNGNEAPLMISGKILRNMVSYETGHIISIKANTKVMKTQFITQTLTENSSPKQSIVTDFLLFMAENSTSDQRIAIEESEIYKSLFVVSANIRPYIFHDLVDLFAEITGVRISQVLEEFSNDFRRGQ